MLGIFAQEYSILRRFAKKDRQRVLKAALKIITLTEEELQWADANGDNAIGLEDAQHILKIIE